VADLTYDQLSAATSAADGDLVAVYIVSDALLKKMEFSVFKQAVADALGNTFLQAPNNLSDLNSASAARANLGLGTVATLASTAVFQVANNLSEVANANTARDNIGACAKDAPMITSGITYFGSHKANVQAVASTSLDLSTAEFFTKSISTNTAFTFANATASKGQAFVLELTISSAAVPSWPAGVDHPNGINPSASLGNGRHVLGFITFNGGTDWLMVVLGKAAA
jgi:hypothetical protein